MMPMKRFFSKHSRSSAVVVTLVLHGILIIAGLSMVVMKTMIDDKPEFYHRAPLREPIPLRNLRPPSNVRNAKPARPNFTRVPVKPDVDRRMPEVQLPEMKGLKGEIGSAVGSNGDALSTIAFSMPEMKIFNVKGKGEKIFLILDAGESMLEDEMGGIPAYTIIKQEMIRIINELPSTAVFNVCVFGNGQTKVLFPKLVSATPSHAQLAAAWLAPLNGTDESVQSGRYGIQTLGRGGIEQNKDMRVGRFAEASKDGARGYGQERWFVPAMVAMQQQADTVFLLTNTWGNQRIVSEKRTISTKEWFQTSDGKRWLEYVEKAKEKLAEENRRRKDKGQPPRVIAHGRWGLMRAYYPDIQRPPSPEFYYFTPKDFQEAFDQVWTSALPRARSGFGKSKNKYTFNVVQFVPVNSGTGNDERFKKLTRLSRGGYQTVAGLEAIQSYLEAR